MRIFATALLVLGSVCVAQAQEPAAPDANDKANMLPGLVASSTPKAYFVNSFAASGAPVFPVTKPMTTFDAPAVATSLALPFDAADPGAPAPKPKFLYSRDDIVRWQLGLGFNWIRFRSSIFNANARSCWSTAGGQRLPGGDTSGGIPGCTASSAELTSSRKRQGTARAPTVSNWEAAPITTLTIDFQAASKATTSGPAFLARARTTSSLVPDLSSISRTSLSKR